jgi:hypothetical protein
MVQRRYFSQLDASVGATTWLRSLHPFGVDLLAREFARSE